MQHKTGRPSKGERHVIVTRPAKPVADLVMKNAAAQGMSISDYVAALLAHAHGLPEFAPKAAYDQEVLPLKTA